MRRLGDRRGHLGEPGQPARGLADAPAQRVRVDLIALAEADQEQRRRGELAQRRDLDDLFGLAARAEGGEQAGEPAVEGGVHGFGAGGEPRTVLAGQGADDDHFGARLGQCLPGVVGQGELRHGHFWLLARSRWYRAPARSGS